MSAIASSMTASRASSAESRRSTQLVRRLLQRSCEERGANIIEMAFVAMFLFLFIAGIVDLGPWCWHCAHCAPPPAGPVAPVDGEDL